LSEWKALPGQTPIDISCLKPLVKAEVRTRAQLNLVEAENIRKAVSKYLASRPTRRTAPFDLGWVRRLHKQMFGDVWKWAGEFRQVDLNIGIKWSLVQDAVQNLLSDRECWEETGMDFVEQAARLHHCAVHIHPFHDGNGRWARLLSNILLRLHGYCETQWPEDLIGTESAIRQEYIAAIQAADQGDYEPLLILHRRYTPAALPGRRKSR
jgi:Fic-DOC domain mobile mystery protein B